MLRRVEFIFYGTQQQFTVSVKYVSALFAQLLATCFPTSLTSLPCPGVHVGQNKDALRSGHCCFGAAEA